MERVEGDAERQQHLAERRGETEEGQIPREEAAVLEVGEDREASPHADRDAPLARPFVRRRRDRETRDVPDRHHPEEEQHERHAPRHVEDQARDQEERLLQAPGPERRERGIGRERHEEEEQELDAIEEQVRLPAPRGRRWR